MDEILPRDQLLQFTRRWNVLKHKLQKAEHFLSLLSFEQVCICADRQSLALRLRCRCVCTLQAMYYARSANHDVRALHTLVHHAAQTVAPRMVCKKVRSPGLAGR